LCFQEESALEDATPGRNNAPLPAPLPPQEEAEDGDEEVIDLDRSIEDADAGRSTEAEEEFEEDGSLPYEDGSVDMSRCLYQFPSALYTVALTRLSLQDLLISLHKDRSRPVSSYFSTCLDSFPPCRHPAINYDPLRCDIGSVIGCEKDDGRRHLLWPSQTFLESRLLRNDPVFR
jgi:hypothetical protein